MKIIVSFFALLLCAHPAVAKIVEYSLTIQESTVAPAGRNVTGLTINGGIPGPLLRFREGDTARIHVHNGLRKEEVSTHWHGLLLPNVEDGVPYLTTPPILPGQSRTFEFPLDQAGTYWYHSHTKLQEQNGVFGSIVIDPKNGERVQADQEAVLVLSDWTNENPSEVMRTLMRGSEWYSIKKGTPQSILGAYEAGFLTQYFNREKARLAPMDISDVAYDAFLINGQRRSGIEAKPGSTIRLRVINAAASTYFYLGSATGPLTIVAADGMDVQPIKQGRLLIGMAETYDLIVTIPSNGRWEFRATAQDGSGSASFFMGTGVEKPAPDVEKANPYSMSVALATILDQLDETGNLSDREALATEKPRPLPPYKRLKSVKPTLLPIQAPVRKITLKLSGDMMRYLWTINGTTLTEDSTIPVKRGEVLQMEIINNSMMHHPMHLHGHFFRLLMPDSADPKFAPLKHTVDVPPMSRRTIEFYANAEKDWAFHCHLLYHMHAGMMKVLSYEDENDPHHEPALDLASENPFYFMLDGNLQSHMSMGSARLMNSRNDFMAMWDVGWGHDPMMMMSDARHGGMMHQEKGPEVEYEVDLMYARYLNPRWMLFGGYRLTNRMDQKDSFIAGAMYQMPYRVDSQLTVESNGDVRLGLMKTFQLTGRLSMFGRVEYDTSENWMWMTGANFILSKNLGLTATYDSDYGFGAGISFHF